MSNVVDSSFGDEMTSLRLLASFWSSRTAWCAAYPIVVKSSFRVFCCNRINASFVAAGTFHDWVSDGSVWIGRTVITTWTASLAPLVIVPLLPFLVLGMRAAWRSLHTRPYYGRQAATNTTLRVWIVLTFFVDMILSNITNRGYAHYYVTMIPAMTLLTTMSLPVVKRSRFP